MSSPQVDKSNADRSTDDSEDLILIQMLISFKCNNGNNSQDQLLTRFIERCTHVTPQDLRPDPKFKLSGIVDAKHLSTTHLIATEEAPLCTLPIS